MAQPIHPDTHLGAVVLTVRDGDRARSFYERVLGLTASDGEDGAVRLGPAGGPALVELVADPDAPARPPGTTGLFHLALLVPGRAELGMAARRVVASGWRFAGASDHLVSEALYLEDPEGNGIEVYRDRPRGSWQRGPEGIRMATLPLDLRALLDEEPPRPEEVPDGAPGEPRMGHVHLNVDSLERAEAFYGDLLGFDVTVRGYPGALFMSAGGYHHHLGLNTWNGAGAPAPPPGSAGLRRFEVVVPDIDELERLAAVLDDGGAGLSEREGTLDATDPSGAAIRLRAAA